MGSVTSYDVINGQKKRHELPNFSSDEATSGNGSETENEMNNNGRLIKNASDKSNISKRDIKMQKKIDSIPDSKYPKPKPRSVQSVMSTGSSSNISSSKSSDSNRAMDSPTVKIKKGINDNSSKSNVQNSPNLEIQSKQSKTMQKMREQKHHDSNADKNEHVENVVNHENGKYLNEQNNSTQDSNTANSKSHSNNDFCMPDKNVDVKLKGQLGRSKSYIDLDGDTNANKGLR